MTIPFPLDHIGIAVPELEPAIENYQKAFGYTLELREHIPNQQVDLAFLTLENTKIELLAPSSPSSTLTKFLENRGQGLHHLCYEVSNIELELSRFEKLGYTLIDKVPRPGAHGTKIAFLHPRHFNGVLTELCQYS